MWKNTAFPRSPILHTLNSAYPQFCIPYILYTLNSAYPNSAYPQFCISSILHTLNCVYPQFCVPSILRTLKLFSGGNPESVINLIKASQCSACPSIKAAVTLSRNWWPMDTRKWSITWSSGISWQAEDFAESPEVDADAGETQPGFRQWLMMRSWMAQCFYDRLRPA